MCLGNLVLCYFDMNKAKSQSETHVTLFLLHLFVFHFFLGVGGGSEPQMKLATPPNRINCLIIL